MNSMHSVYNRAQFWRDAEADSEQVLIMFLMRLTSMFASLQKQS